VRVRKSFCACRRHCACVVANRSNRYHENLLLTDLRPASGAAPKRPMRRLLKKEVSLDTYTWQKKYGHLTSKAMFAAIDERLKRRFSVSASMEEIPQVRCFSDAKYVYVCVLAAFYSFLSVVCACRFVSFVLSVLAGSQSVSQHSRGGCHAVR
jgi:hypothetical protein